jgi:teichuronic acid biosynthesis glycosyltransferase TuaH
MGVVNGSRADPVGATFPGDWRNLVVFCAATPWDGNRFPDQHMAERLTRWAPVLYVDPPRSVLAARRHRESAAALEGPRLRPLGTRLARLTPVVVPGTSRRPIRPITERLTRRAIGRAVRQLGGDVEVTVAATVLPVFGAAGERRRVFYATDDFAAGASLMGLDAEWVARCERQALRAADTVVVVSHHLADKWRSGTVDPVVVENGVDDARFAAADDAPLPDDVTLAPPIAGFVGHLSDRIDIALLEAVAARGVSLLLVGPRQLSFEIGRLDRLLERRNVQWVGPKPFDQLPSYVRVMDVGLLPYADSDFNRASFPLKVLEYLAAGRPAIATDLPAVRAIGDVVRIARSATDYADAVEEALAAPADAEAAAARRATAAGRSWDAAAARFAEAIGIG